MEQEPLVKLEPKELELCFGEDWDCDALAFCFFPRLWKNGRLVFLVKGCTFLQSAFKVWVSSAPRLVPLDHAVRLQERV